MEFNGISLLAQQWVILDLIAASKTSVSGILFLFENISLQILEELLLVKSA